MRALGVTAAGLIGLCIGSFLNVVIHRVPLRQSIAHPGSACPQCERVLGAGELIPVASWMLQRGRCRGCAARISVRYPVVELLTAALFAVLAARFADPWAAAAFCILAAGCVALSAIDLDTHTLPTRVIAVVAAVGGVALIAAALMRGEPERLLGAALAAGAVGMVFAAVWFAAPSGFGFGDVRFGAMLGLFLGWLGLQPVLYGMVIAFGLGAIVGLVLMAVGRATRSTALPLGPALAVGALAAAVWMPA